MFFWDTRLVRKVGDFDPKENKFLLFRDVAFNEEIFPFAKDLLDSQNCAPTVFHTLPDFGESLAGLRHSSRPI